MSQAPLTPTYVGHIETTRDALLIFEGILNGTISHVPRRPHDRERSALIQSGHCYIYEEHCSGIKRWTDGVPWSPSRILGNFLVYRELDKPFPPGEKKRANKRGGAVISSGISKEAGATVGTSHGYNLAPTSHGAHGTDVDKDQERALIGSLVDSYEFKEAGLVKKTMSATVGGVQHHLVSYYTIADIVNKKLNTPSRDSKFCHLNIRHELLHKQNLRSPLDEVEYTHQPDPFQTPMNERSGYANTNQTMTRTMAPLPAPTMPYNTNNFNYNHSSAPQSFAPYDPGFTGNSAALPSQFPGHGNGHETYHNTPQRMENFQSAEYRTHRQHSFMGIPAEMRPAPQQSQVLGFSRHEQLDPRVHGYYPQQHQTAANHMNQRSLPAPAESRHTPAYASVGGNMDLKLETPQAPQQRTQYQNPAYTQPAALPRYEDGVGWNDGHPQYTQ